MIYILYLAAFIVFVFGIYTGDNFLLSIGSICGFTCLVGIVIIKEIRGNK